MREHEYHTILTTKCVYRKQKQEQKRQQRSISKRMKNNRKRTDWIVAEHKREAVEKEERKESRFEKKKTRKIRK